MQKTDKLLRRGQFVYLSRKADSVADRLFVVAFCENHLVRPRLGVTVTRKVGSAVVRNRIKRIVRQYFRTNRHRLGGNFDINVIARKSAAEASSNEMFASLEKLFCKIRGNCH
ncbi:MAG: ribonuclease P protein component [Desulfosalsimonas sp.]